MAWMKETPSPVSDNSTETYQQFLSLFESFHDIPPNRNIGVHIGERQDVGEQQTLLYWADRLPVELQFLAKTSPPPTTTIRKQQWNNADVLKLLDSLDQCHALYFELTFDNTTEWTNVVLDDADDDDDGLEVINLSSPLGNTPITTTTTARVLPKFDNFMDGLDDDDDDDDDDEDIADEEEEYVPSMLASLNRDVSSAFVRPDLFLDGYTNERIAVSQERNRNDHDGNNDDDEEGVNFNDDRILTDADLMLESKGATPAIFATLSNPFNNASRETVVCDIEISMDSDADPDVFA